MAFGSDSPPIEARVFIAEEEVAIAGYHKAPSAAHAASA